MPGRRFAWTVSEISKLITHYDNTMKVLTEMFPRHPPASIARQLTRLRNRGLIGPKSEETRTKAYEVRSENRRVKREIKEYHDQQFLEREERRKKEARAAKRDRQ